MRKYRLQPVLNLIAIYCKIKVSVSNEIVILVAIINIKKRN